MPETPVHHPRTPSPAGRVDRTTPLAWTTSIAVHLLVLAAASLITWSVVGTPEDRPVVVVAAPNATPRWESVSSLAAKPSTPPATSSRSVAATTRSEVPVEADDLADLLLATEDLLAASTPLAETVGAPGPAGVEFAGVEGPAASRIVFVVDASGSMIGAFPAVVAEVERSLRRLDASQAFSVLLFQGEDVLAPPSFRRGLRPATPGAVDDVASWLRNTTPQGGSDPTRTLKAAFALDPQVIYVVSTDITGAGRYEIDRSRLFETLEALNPPDAEGRRPVVVRGIQLLEQDPLGTLREIARRHGGNPDAPDDPGFAFIGRAELGLD